MTKLHEACEKGDFEEIKRLLDLRHDEETKERYVIGDKDKDGRTPVEIAIQFGNIKIVHHLLKRYMPGIDISLIHSEKVHAAYHQLYFRNINNPKVDRFLLASCYRIFAHMGGFSEPCLLALDVIKPICNTTDKLRYKTIKIIDSYNFLETSNYNRARLLLEEALKILGTVQVKDDHYFNTRTQLFSSLAKCYTKLSQHDKAISTYQRALDACTLQNNLEAVINVQSSIKSAYKNANNDEAYLAHLFEVFMKYENNKEDEKIIFPFLFHTLQDICDVYAKQEETKPEAKRYLLRAMDYVTEKSFGVLCISICVLLKDLQPLSNSTFEALFYKKAYLCMSQLFEPGAVTQLIDYVNFMINACRDSKEHKQAFEQYVPVVKKMLDLLLRIHDRFIKEEPKDKIEEVVTSLEKLYSPQHKKKSSLSVGSIFRAITAGNERRLSEAIGQGNVMRRS